MKLKVFLISFFLIGLSVTLFWTTRGSLRPSSPEQAHRFFVEGNLPAARKTLDETPLEGQSIPLSLYRAYLAQAEGQFAESERLLEPFTRLKPSPQKNELITQATLALINASYQTKQDSQIFQRIESVKSICPAHPGLLFFDGLSYYLKQQYGEAYRQWTAFYPNKFEQEEAWLTTLIDLFYPLSWRHIHLAHCLIEKGDICRGREILEREQHQLGSTENRDHHLATLFLGLTYLKEAKDLPSAERFSHYQLAHFYFKHASLLDGFDREKNRVISHLEKELIGLLSQTLAPENHLWTFSFIHLLEEWEAQESLDQLAGYFVDRLKKEKDPIRAQICTLLKKPSLYHDLVCHKMTHCIEEALLRDQGAELSNLWQFLQDLAPIEHSFLTQIASTLEKHLLRSVVKDDLQLSRSKSLIAFYQRLLNTEETNLSLSLKLLDQATQLWQQVGQEERGYHLMQLARDISMNKPMIETVIAEQLKLFYKRAEENNLLSRLILVHDALTHFGVTLNKPLCNEAKIANHIADAEYLYEVRNYLAAYTHATWVLKLDPSNYKAQRIVGLSSFYLGDYKEALNHLTTLSEPDLRVQKAIAFSRAYAKEAQEEHIAQIDASEGFSEDE